MKTLTIQEKITHCRANAKVGSKINVWRNNSVIHTGYITRLTTSGAFVFDPRKDSGDTTADHAQWYAFEARNGGYMTLVKD